MRNKERSFDLLVEALRAGEVDVGVLADRFGVSASTVRRDLQRLSDQNAVLRTYGGAVLAHAPPEVPFSERMQAQGAGEEGNREPRSHRSCAGWRHASPGCRDNRSGVRAIAARKAVARDNLQSCRCSGPVGRSRHGTDRSWRHSASCEALAQLVRLPSRPCSD